MNEVIAARFNNWRIARNVMRHLHASLPSEDFRTIDAYMDSPTSVVVAVVISERLRLDKKTYIEAILSQGHKIELTPGDLEAGINSAEAAWLGLATKRFPDNRP